MRLNRFWSGLAIAYGLFVIYGTLFPFAFSSVVTNIGSLKTQPLSKVFQHGHFAGYGDILSNLIFFFPLGFFLGKILRSRSWNYIHLLPIILLSGMLSTLVEYMQLYTVNRNTSWVDILCNVLGGSMGGLFAMYLRTPPIFNSQNVRVIILSRWFIPALSALIIVVLECLQPFNFSLGKAAILQKASLVFTLQTNTPPFYLLGLIRYALLFTVATGILCAWLFELSWKNYGIWAVLSYVLLGTVLEGFQLIILSRIPGPIEFGCILVGSFSGWLLFKFIPQQKVIPSVVFWALVGMSIAVLFSSSIPANMDYFKISQLPHFSIRSPQSQRVSILISHLTLFFFIGIMIPYLFYRYRQHSIRTLVNSLVLVLTFGATVKFGTRFSPLQSAYKYVLPLAGMFMGYLVCVWMLSVVRENKDDVKDPSK